MATQIVGTKEEWSAKGRDIYRYLILPHLKPEDRNKFVAIDIDTGEFELDFNDVIAGDRLKAKCPESRMWMERVGHAAAIRMYSIRGARGK